MHKLLEHQLRKAAEGQPGGMVNLDRLIDLIDQAYTESDRERRLKDRALDVMQSENEALSRRIIEEAEVRFNLVMDNIGEAVVVFDAIGRISTFNRAAEQIFGYSAEEIRGRNIQDIIANGEDSDQPLLDAVTNQISRDFGAGGKLAEGIRRDGCVFPAEIALGEMPSQGSLQYIGIIRDVTIRNEAEALLRESESRFQDLANSASDWFWETDSDYRLTFTSERIGTVLGVKPAAVEGSSWFDLGLEDHPQLAAAHRADIAARVPFRDVEFHVGPPSGTDSRIIRLSGIPLFASDGRFLGYRGVGADITREAAAIREAARAQEQLRDAIDSLSDGIAVYDASQKLVICNRAYAAPLEEGGIFLSPGITFEQIMRMAHQVNFFDMDTQDFDSWLGERLHRFRNASGRPFIFKLSNGRWVQSRECPTSGGGVVAVRTDITPLMEREEELDHLRRRYELILDSAGDGIVGLSHRGCVTFANRMAGEILGRNPADMTGECFYCLIRPEVKDCEEPCAASASPLVAAYLSGAPLQMADQIFNVTSKRRIPVDFFIAPMLNDQELAGAVLVFRDATFRLQYEQSQENQQRELERLVDVRTAELRREVDVRTRTEAALRASRERLKGITDSLVEGVIVVDRQGLVSFANPSARQLLECPEDGGDIEGHPLDMLMRLRRAEGDVAFTEGMFRKVITENITWSEDDAVFVTSTGRPVAVAFSCSPAGEDEARRTAIISFRNIEALKRAQREALQSSRMASVGQLAAGIAHEINTPIQYVGDNLRFIEGAVQKLAGLAALGHEVALAATAGDSLGDAVDKFQSQFAAAKIAFILAEVPTAVTESLDGVSQIARIVLSMKEFSHPGTSNKTMTDINRALESTLTVSRNVWKHAAEVERRFDPSLPQVLCHAGELNQVFLNLIVNATHAIEASGKPLPGRITISTRHRGDMVEVAISDTGSGVPQALRDRIFDPFFTTKDVGKGTGQGLAICRDVVVGKHDGRLDVGGMEGEGAEFIVSLPVDGHADMGKKE